MKLESMYNFDDLTNEAERLVIEELELQLEKRGDNTNLSEELLLDMAAYALNHVKPLYHVNLVGRLYAHSMREEHAEEVRRAVAEAISKIAGGEEA